MNANILLVEDEEKLARFVELELMHEGYQVEKSGNGREALEMALKNNYDLILLDIMLPGLNGLEVLRRLLKEKEVPVILLTARDAVMDKVSGLDAGAVDYITKPFAIEELLARIRVALKLHAGHWTAGQGNGSRDQEEGVFKWQDLVLDDRRHQVRYAGHEVNLTNREFLMLRTLLENRDIGVFKLIYSLEFVQCLLIGLGEFVFYGKRHAEIRDRVFAVVGIREYELSLPVYDPELCVPVDVLDLYGAFLGRFCTAGPGCSGRSSGSSAGAERECHNGCKYQCDDLFHLFYSSFRFSFR